MSQEIRIYRAVIVKSALGTLFSRLTVIRSLKLSKIDQCPAIRARIEGELYLYTVEIMHISMKGQIIIIFGCSLIWEPLKIFSTALGGVFWSYSLILFRKHRLKTKTTWTTSDNFKSIGMVYYQIWAIGLPFLTLVASRNGSQNYNIYSYFLNSLKQ